VKQINYTRRNSLPGDLAMRDGHVAMVVGNGMMIQANDQ
jgi:cell wall-associated NlpC family hydrolase